MSISYGLVNSSDIFMGEWNGGILGPHGVSFFLHIIGACIQCCLDFGTAAAREKK
jgi:hypothetical protein